MFQEPRPIIKESNRSKSTTIFNRLLANDLFGQKRKERTELILSKLNVSLSLVRFKFHNDFLFTRTGN